MVKAVVYEAHGGRGSISSWAKSTFKLVSELEEKVLGSCNRFEKLIVK